MAPVVWRVALLTLSLATVCMAWSRNSSADASVPLLTAQNFDAEFSKHKRLAVLFFNSDDHDSDELTRVYRTVFLSFRYSPELYLAQFDTESDEDWEFAQEEVKVKKVPMLKLFDNENDSARSYKGSLTAESISEYLTKRTAVQPASDHQATVKHMLPTNEALHRFHALANEYLEATPQRRDKIMRLVQRTRDAIALQPYGGDYSRVADEFVAIMTKVHKAQMTKADVVKEIERIRRLLAGKVSSDKQKPLEDKLSLWESYISRIPKIVHFIKVDGVKQNFQLLHYLAVRSAHHFIKPDKIIFHAPYEPEGEWWQRCRHLVELHNVMPPFEIKGKPLSLAAHQSDFMRLDYLIEQGGIYLDWDYLTTRSFDDLLASTTIMGLEKHIGKLHEVIGVAVMMSRPGSQFFKRFRQAAIERFDGGRCYACHSTGVARNLTRGVFEEIRILNHTAFYHPGWEESAVRLLFDPDRYTKGAKLAEGPFYGMHMFESHRNFQLIAEPMLNVEKILDVDNHFSALFRRFFKESWRATKPLPGPEAVRPPGR